MHIKPNGYTRKGLPEFLSENGPDLLRQKFIKIVIDDLLPGFTDQMQKSRVSIQDRRVFILV